MLNFPQINLQAALQEYRDFVARIAILPKGSDLQAAQKHCHAAGQRLALVEATLDSLRDCAKRLKEYQAVLHGLRAKAIEPTEYGLELRREKFENATAGYIRLQTELLALLDKLPPVFIDLQGEAPDEPATEGVLE